MRCNIDHHIRPNIQDSHFLPPKALYIKQPQNHIPLGVWISGVRGHYNDYQSRNTNPPLFLIIVQSFEEIKFFALYG